MDLLPEDPVGLFKDVNPLFDIPTYNLSFSDAGKFIIPGPYTLASVLKDVKGIYPSFDSYVIALADYLSKELSELPFNIGFVQFDEPYLVWKQLSRKHRDAIIQSYEILRDYIGARTAIINTFFGDASGILPFLIDLDGYGIGIDFLKTNPLELEDYDFSSKFLQAGIVDSQNFKTDDGKKVNPINQRLYTKLIELLLSTNPERLFLTSTGPLEFLPRDIADQKIRQLANLIAGGEF